MARIRYILSTSLGQTILANHPDGWMDDARKIVRDNKMYGVMYEYAGTLSFSGDGYNLITAEISRKGHDARILLERQTTNIQDAWVTDYIGELDILTKSETDRTISFKLSESGLQKQIKAKYNDKFELDRTTDLNGNDIGLPTYDLITLNGRNVLYVSELEKDSLQNETMIGDSVNGFENYYFPNLDKKFSPPDQNINGTYGFPLKPLNNGNDFRPNLNSTHFFYDRVEQDKQINIKITYDAVLELNNSGFDAYLLLWIYDYDNGNYTYSNGITLFEVVNSSTNNHTINVDYNGVIQLQENQSIAIGWYVRNIAQTSGSTFQYRVIQNEYKVAFNEDSQYPPTKCYGMSVFNAINRLTQIITGEKRLVSNVLTEEWKYLYISSGKRIRGFRDPITISLKSLIDSLYSISGISYSVEGQKLRVEPLRYFMDRNTLFNINIDKVVETYNKNKIVNTIEVGYKFDGEYEERQGLDEYNVKSSYTHNFISTDKTIKHISEVRADSYGIEFARRKQIDNYPTQDTPYDRVNFFIDCKIDGFLQVRLWNDDFTNLPSGIYSPETAFNLRLSPVQNLYRLSDSFSSIVDYPNAKTLFMSSDGNSDLVTDKPERSDIINSDFNLPLFSPIELQGQCKLTNEQYKELLNNPYKLVKYSYKGLINYGWIKEYDPKGEGKIKLIKANF